MFDQSLHDKIKRKNKTAALCVTFFVLAFTVLRMFMTRLFIDPDLHYYIEPENIFVLSVDYIIAACIVIIYFISFFIYKHKIENHNYIETADCFVQGTQTQVFSASLTALLFAFASAFQAYSFINPENALGDIQALSLIGRFIAYIKNYPFDFPIFAAAVLCAVYFFKTASLNFDIGDPSEQIPAVKTETETKTETEEAEKTKKSEAGSKCKFSSAHVIFSFMPIIWAFLNVFKCFFDMSKSVNSPVRTYELMTFLFLSTYFVSESRMLVERRELSRFFTFSYIAVIVTAASSLPNLIWSSFWMLQTNNDQIVYAVEISLAVYIFSRIYSQIRYGRFLLQR